MIHLHTGCIVVPSLLFMIIFCHNKSHETFTIHLNAPSFYLKKLKDFNLNLRSPR